MKNHSSWWHSKHTKPIKTSRFELNNTKKKKSCMWPQLFLRHVQDRERRCTELRVCGNWVLACLYWKRWSPCTAALATATYQAPHPNSDHRSGEPTQDSHMQTRPLKTVWKWAQCTRLVLKWLAAVPQLPAQSSESKPELKKNINTAHWLRHAFRRAKR